MSRQMLRSIIIVLLSGGSMSGKSTSKRRIAQEFGSQVYTGLNEAATALFESGLRPPIGPQASQLNILFQEMIWRYQRYSEMTLIPEAQQAGAKIVILDRGIFDGAAYLPGGRAELLSMIDQTEEQVFASVDVVIHLESLVMTRPELFGPQGNANRYETAEQATALELRTRQAWQGHPDWRFIPSAGGIDHVCDQVLDIIRQLLSQQVEQKWLLTHLPELDYLSTPLLIEQDYVSIAPDAEVRLRKICQQYWQGTKTGQGLSRYRNEYSINRATYQALLQASIGRIDKLRFSIDDGQGVVFVDVFQGPLEGLLVAEKKFPTASQSQAYLPPSWLPIVREVTEDPRYRNVNLAQWGIPAD